MIYINGTEVARSSMPTGTITYTTPATGTSSETTFFAHTAPASVLVEGTNVIAVEIHQSGPHQLGHQLQHGSDRQPLTSTARRRFYASDTVGTGGIPRILIRGVLLVRLVRPMA